MERLGVRVRGERLNADGANFVLVGNSLSNFEARQVLNTKGTKGHEGLEFVNRGVLRV